MFENLEHDLKILIQDFEANEMSKDDFLEEIRSTIRDHKKEAQEQKDKEGEGL